MINHVIQLEILLQLKLNYLREMCLYNYLIIYIILLLIH
jgi:hypothetical protein